MLIALDFDGTYTACPGSWFCSVPHFQAHGHEIITVTSRRKTLENEQAMRQAGVTWPIVFAYDCPKRLAAILAGYAVDVWIDDNPQGIGDGTENVSTQSVFEIELRHAYDVLKTMRFDCPIALAVLLQRIETVLGGEHDAPSESTEGAAVLRSR